MPDIFKGTSISSFSKNRADGGTLKKPKKGRAQKRLKLGCPFKLLQKVKPDWQIAADATDYLFLNPPSLMTIYMGVAKWRYLKIIAFSNTEKRARKGRVQTTRVRTRYRRTEFVRLE